MGFFRFLSALSPAHIFLFTLTYRGRKVGEDNLGNRYYEGKARAGYKRSRRWVMYKDEAEASLVPPEWHGWLHHQTDDLPSAKGLSFRRKWQKPHPPNRTGTNAAYRPPGHVLEGGQRDAGTGDYSAWSPPQ